MKLFLIIAACVALPIFLSLFMALVAALAHVWRGGTAEAREFARAGIGLPQFFGASVAKQDSGSLISTRAGISLRVTDKGLLVNETRTVAKDVF
ncbi:hypothetical protein ASG37_15730 [Sphingomonas sp. Leaf407]|uniref:hypothetical protein n=1 Tax=unclassified Sphingomonas TaxID=196159 RepID=UPI0006F484EB|nr:MULTISPECIES: hypothetical protein [unclassified Sphingomonas]KQN34770.1 hypothetical protein ASE97_14985 [Sphingomonas sp. Leaf42]KQT25323.1 hypothetical protein ASG37_15730 [Sphingomonas sp. Leaf407]